MVRETKSLGEGISPEAKNEDIITVRNIAVYGKL